mmetsp:Transcript_62787/g.173689  ORF Transcript_62787/g.173689 Transcript_62787/m.173689 type:complete len:486 (-) Transcript_62787:113-1570(-)|eukprot:CAMPEP_0176209244 /NCGR_PEP_ID=MMETSP0121_2-20121125/13534_1 /TAXON_ID=160619 /ORGANISM="Kryptoperidinium foliaceum, Strain CCMP 1326" /LENGTH=485 /DNA_ID=CAMNT_0017548251 /DNA_START=30 /DNA_END=1487 /DNA_ORIENTATION=+
MTDRKPEAAGPSAAAAAGAAAAALLQKQLAADGAVLSAETSLASGWSEHQTGDGRKFFYHEDTQTCSWEKPEVLMTPEERAANDTNWREYKIWDGRSFFHNRETKVSCWSMPPELRKLRGESSGVDDRPIPETAAEMRRVYWDLMKEKGVDESWTWQGVSEAMRDEPQAMRLSEPMRKQCFAELLGFHKRQKDVEARKRERGAASAFERLVEERFCKPEDLTITYEEAAQQLSGEEAWGLVKSDVRRDELFQTVMERLEEKHKKARLEGRAARILRLQRLMASDPELKRSRARWKDACELLARKDEIQEELPPLEAIRVWSSLRDLRHSAEYESDEKGKEMTPEASKLYRDERRRRDVFVRWLKDLAIQSRVSDDSSWDNFFAVAQGDPKLVSLQQGRGAGPMELFDEFQEDLRRLGPAEVLGVIPGSAEAAAVIAAQAAQEAGQEAPRKRQRTGFSEDVPAFGGAAPEEDTNALDALIAGGLPQ